MFRELQTIPLKSWVYLTLFVCASLAVINAAVPRSGEFGRRNLDFNKAIVPQLLR